jgi:LysM repeat protein
MKETYTPYKGGAGPKPDQITANDLHLLGLLRKEGVPAKYEIDKDWITEIGFDEEFKTINITRESGNTIHVSYDRYGFNCDELDLDNAPLDETLSIIDQWYHAIQENKMKEIKKESIMKNNIAAIRKSQIKNIEEKLQKLTGGKIIYSEKKEEIKKEKTSEATETIETKEAPSTSAPILGNIIPDSSIKAMDTYLSEILTDIQEEVAELQAIKKDLTKKATAGSEDYYTKIEKLQFNVKQIARLAQYASNTIKANKFDKELLDKILNNKID